MIDLYYSFYLTNDFDSLKKLSLGWKHLDNYFSKNWLNEIGNILDIGTCYKDFAQDEIDLIFTDYALFFHENINPEFLINRGITAELISRYKLGSTHAFEIDSEQIGLFLKKIMPKYKPELIKRLLDYHIYIYQLNNKYYNSPYCVTIPSFDENNICKGIVYRVINYHPRTDTIRNMCKFHVSHAPTYIFNQQILNAYDTIFLVEGVFDALSMIKIGYENTLSVSHTKLSKYHIPHLKDKNVIIIYDNDIGGLSGMEYIYQYYSTEFKSLKCYQCPLKDIDEFIRQNEIEAKQWLQRILK